MTLSVIHVPAEYVGQVLALAALVTLVGFYVGLKTDRWQMAAAGVIAFLTLGVSAL